MSPGIERYGMTLLIRSEKVEDYVKAHDDIWPEVKYALQQVGVVNLSIFLCGDQPRLFMYLEYTRGGQEEFKAAMARYSQMPRIQEWEDWMRTMQVQLPGTAPDQWWQDCRQLYHAP